MKKSITILCLALGMSLFSGHVIGQTAAQNPCTKLTTAVQNGVKVMVSAGTKSRVDFLNTGNEDITFSWSIVNKSGEVIFTSSVIKLQAGTACAYPNTDELSKLDKGHLLDGVEASQIKITIQK